eukprot:16371800-Heterocapsa_arctica.AAC.1
MGQGPPEERNATAAGVSYEDWIGNNEADIQAKERTENMDTRWLRSMTSLTRSHWPRPHRLTCCENFIIYINHPDVRKYALYNKEIKGTPTGTKGRQIIRPEQMGHEVQTCGDYKYCLGCGRSTKAKHRASAKR